MRLAIDIETYSSIDLKTAGVYRYVESEDFNVLLFTYKKDNGEITVEDLTKAPLSKKVIELLYDKSVIKHAYNANFEYQCINKYLESLGFTEPMPISSWVDTMLLSAYAGLGGSLEQSAEALGLSVNKDPAGKRLIRRFSKPRKPTAKNPNTRFYPEDDPDKWEQFIEYNKRDVEVENELYELLYPLIELPEREIEGWRLDLRIAAEGIKIDTALVKSAIEIDRDEKTRLTARIKEITQCENPNSNAQITKWLTKRLNTPITSIAKDKVEGLKELCREKKDKDALEVLNLRAELSKTSLKKYHALNERLCNDGRIHGVLQFYGSHTGRWAGRGVQVQNLPRNSLPGLDSARELLKTRNTEALALIYSKPVSNIASELIRTCFIPESDNAYIVVDYSAIEARVIAWLSGERWRLDVFKTTGKIYEASAAQIFNVDFNKICDKNAPEHKLRAQGKVAELALGYQGAVGAIARMDFNNDIPEDKREGIVRKWREANPKIVSLWREFQEAARDAMRKYDAPYRVRGVGFRCENYGLNALIITLPSGRELYYPAPKDEGQALSYIGLNQQTRKLERIETYGGKLVENVVQAIARDILSESLLRLDKEGFKIRFHVHDEVIVEVSQDEAESALERVIELMCTPPEWGRDLPLNAEGFISDYYMKE